MECYNCRIPMPSPWPDPQNRLFQLAHSGHRFPKRWYYTTGAIFYGLLAPQFLAICLGIFLVIGIAATSPGNPSGAWAVLDRLVEPRTPIDMALGLLVSFIPIYLLVWAWLWLFERRPLWTTGIERPGWLRKYGRGILVGLFMFCAALAIEALSGTLHLSAPIKIPSLALVAGLAGLLLGWMVQGAAEEVLARGFILPVVGVRWGLWIGILISSTLFALLHLFNPNLNPLAMLNLGLFGLFAALYALVEGSLWGIFAIHSIWNFAQGNIFGLPVSGMNATYSLLQLQASGADWLTGGAFGPEGGLAVTIILVISCLLVLLWNKSLKSTVAPAPIQVER